jgi:uncharacterized protein (DUF1015 family)
VLKEIPESDRAEFTKKAEEFFSIETIMFDPANLEKGQLDLMVRLGGNHSKNAIGMVMKGSNEFHLFTLKSNVMDQVYGDTLEDAVRPLDVTVLTHLIFMELLGFDQARLDNEKLINYDSNAENAIHGVVNGEYDMAFILNPTKIEQVRNVAEHDSIMPRKSTYFYPKTITGQVMNRLDKN